MGTVYNGSVDANGWSPTIEYVSNNINSVYDRDPGLISSYELMGGATWFMDSYWIKWRWAKMYKNLTTKAQKLTKCSFQACTGNSSGKSFKSSNGRWHSVRGGSCDFYCNIYFGQGSSKYRSDWGYFTRSNATHLGAIQTCNASTGTSAGVVSEWGTKFGSKAIWGTQVCSTTGNPLATHTIEFTFQQEVIIEPGECIFIVVEVPRSSWSYPYGGSEGLIVIENVNADPTSWETDVEPVAKDMIWVMTTDGWKQERSPFQFDGTKWVKMES